MKTFAFWGLLNALAYAALSLALYFTGFQTENLATGQYLAWIGLPLLGVILFLGMKARRDEDLGGHLTYGQGVGAAAGIGLFSGVFAAIYAFIHLTFVHPRFGELIMDLLREEMAAQGMPGAEIDRVESFMAFFLSPTMQAIFGLIMTLSLCVILGLIFAAVLKRAPPAAD